MNQNVSVVRRVGPAYLLLEPGLRLHLLGHDEQSHIPILATVSCVPERPVMQHSPHWHFEAGHQSVVLASQNLFKIALQATFQKVYTSPHHGYSSTAVRRGF